nr:uncharacterized protein LOC113718424 [Coffea arabica]
MAATTALQPLGEGIAGSPTGKKSFSQLFTQPTNPQIQVRPVSTYKGEAAVVFSKEDMDRLAAPFRLALVGKFSHGWPPLEEIRKLFATLNLRDQLSVGLLDYRHVLLKCSAEADFNWLWTRGLWQIDKYPMRVFRWTREFHVHKESSLVPVWVSLPALPIHFHDKNSLFSILSPIRKPLFLDAATTTSTRPSVAKACVEIDLLKTLCSRVWVAVEGEGGFWQKVVMEDVPKYCLNCWRLGHSEEECRKNIAANGATKAQSQGHRPSATATAPA